MVDEWVLHTACAALATWTATLGALAPRSVNVNIRAASLRSDGLADAVLGTAARFGLAPSRLQFELPESADLSALTVTAEGVEHERQLSELTLLGVSHAQGFLLGRPQPAGRPADTLRRQSVPLVS